MASKELRGASRRDFIRGAFAVGAALGWGPARILDFIERGSPTARADCATHGTQNLVVLLGGQGAHGYSTLLFPHPDMFTANRPNQVLSAHFMQNANTGGSCMGVTGLSNAIDYTNAPAESSPSRGTWAAKQVFKRIYGVDNQAFGGFKSQDTTSQANDKAEWGATTVPSNTNLTPDKKFVIASRETPWIHKYGIKKAITSIDGGGINTFHVNGAHNHFINLQAKQSVFAAAATIQLTRPTIVPVILVGSMDASSPELLATPSQFYGDAATGNQVPGAPAPAIVQDSSGMVDLFASNAAKAGGALVNPQNAVLYEAYTKGMIGNSKTAQLPSFTRGYRTAKLGANLVGLNLADQLAPTDADRVRYGYTGNSIGKGAALRDNLIVAAKALKLGLTSQVVIAYFQDDPHNSFSQNGEAGIGDNACFAAVLMSNLLNAFMDDLMAVPDPFCPGISLGDNTVVAFVGDTPRTNVNHNSWNDPTFGSQNRAFIMSNGLLRTGFFGGDRPLNAQDPNAQTSNNHNAKGPGEGALFDLNTGDALPFDPNGGQGAVIGSNDPNIRFKYGETAMAAILYAITRGDIRRVNDFYSGKDFPAIQVPNLI